MKVKVLYKTTVVFEKYLESSTTVKELKKMIKNHLNLASYQIYTRVLSTEVMMTDSWELAFFESLDPSFLKIEVKARYIEKDILEEAISCCTRKDDIGLLALFTDFSASTREILLNKEIENGWTMLHFCCSYNMEEFIVLNCEYFKDFNLETADNWTPLLLATMNNFENIVKFLVELPSIDINKSTSAKPTALHIACKLNLQNIVKVLISNFVDTSIQDSTGKTPLEYATDPTVYNSLVSFAQKLSSKRQKSSIHHEGLLWMENSTFKRNRWVCLKINLSEGVLNVYKTKKNKIEDELPMLKIGLRQIEKVVSVKQVELFSKNFYFKIQYFSKQKVFFHECKSYRDEWVDALCMSIDESKQCPIFKQVQEYSDAMVPILDPNTGKDSFEYLDSLGKGTYGTVVKARSIQTGISYAIKKIPKVIAKNHKLKTYVKRECEILKKMNHPFVISLQHMFKDLDNLNLVFEYCSFGDLERVIRPEGLNENAVRFYIAECLLALEYIQSKNIMHRDLKPANILIDSSGHIKLTDFGLSKEVLKLKDLKATLLGTPLYIGPENIKRSTLTHTYDLYSLGVIMYELITGNAPYCDDDQNKIFKLKTTGKLSIPRHVSVEAAYLLKELLNKNPEKRPNVQQVKEHPFFRFLDWEKLLRKEYKPPLKIFAKEKKDGNININYDSF